MGVDMLDCSLVMASQSPLRNRFGINKRDMR